MPIEPEQNIIIPASEQKVLSKRFLSGMRFVRNTDGTGSIRFDVTPWTGVNGERQVDYLNGEDLVKRININLKEISQLPEVQQMFAACQAAAIAVKAHLDSR